MSKKFAMNKTLLVLGLIMIVNALGYGTIIPLMYPFAHRFGLNALGVGLMFTSFSIAQLIATPILGRLSDKFGRKPLLIACITGSSISFVLMSLATTVPMLFFARILDGITGGNASIAQAVIADSSKPEERARAFGVLGASFGFGFLFGPAIGGILGSINLTAPFWFAAILAAISAILAWWLLPETNLHPTVKKNEPMFNFGKTWQALRSPSLGLVLLATLFVSIANNAYIIGFQSFGVDVLKLSTTLIGLIFTMIGLISVLMQGGGIRFLLSKMKASVLLQVSLLMSALIMLTMYFENTAIKFIVMNIIFGLVSAPIFVVITTLLSQRTKHEDQGEVLGMNQSVMSLGQIVGPSVAGALATYSVNGVFLLSAVVFVISWFIGVAISKQKHALVDV
jgi:multidrug resistance protein